MNGSEIERLKADLERITAQSNSWYKHYLEAVEERNLLAQEVARLKEQLATHNERAA